MMFSNQHLRVHATEEGVLWVVTLILFYQSENGSLETT